MNKINDWIDLLIPLGAGALLGLFFFGGLWVTVAYATSSRTPALWFFVSIILRTGIVLAGFYFVAAGQFPYMIATLVGFIMARFLTTRTLPPYATNPRKKRRPS